MAKRLAHSMLLLFLLVGLGQWTTPGAAAQPGRERRPELGQPGQEPPDFVPGRILVQFRPGTPGQAIADAHRQNGGQERATIPRIDVRVVEVPPGRERALAAIYRNNPNVTFAEVDGFYYALSHGSSYPQDTRFDEQWQYRNTGQTGGRRDADIDAYEAWSVTKGSAGVKIAILDSGIDQSHEDLAAKIDDSRNFTDSSSVEDNFGHGTHVAGIAAAVSNNERGVSGTCPDCLLMNIKVLRDGDGAGAWEWIANGIVWAADNGARVINLSLGAYARSQTVELAVNYAWSKGVVLVGAAGNDGQNWGLYPGAYDRVIAVAASDHRDAKAGLSNYGGNWVELAAPGANVLSTATDHDSPYWPSGSKYGTLSGTSMATPHVAGAAGLVWSKSGLCGNNDCVRNRLQQTADRIGGTGTQASQYWIYGRVNACKAVGASRC